MPSRFRRFAVKIESGTPVASRGTDRAQSDAAGVKGSNRIRCHGAALLRRMPKGCLGSPVLVLLFGLDRGFLMDVGPQRAGHLGLRAHVEVTHGARLSGCLSNAVAAAGSVE